MSEIDVWEIAEKIDEQHNILVREEINEYVDSKGGNVGTQELIEVIGITNTAIKEFTVKLIQETIDQLEKDK